MNNIQYQNLDGYVKISNPTLHSFVNQTQIDYLKQYYIEVKIIKKLADMRYEVKVRPFNITVDQTVVSELQNIFQNSVLKKHQYQDAFYFTENTWY